MSVTIISFKPEYAPIFKALNEAWLKKYFSLELKDIELLGDCEANIINKDGFIYFARHNGKIIGCFALLVYGPRQYELSKMAVDPDHQGLKVGQALLRHAIKLGRGSNWEKLILYTSSHLENALHIYKKYGFKEVPLETDVPYGRSDVKMELILN